MCDGDIVIFSQILFMVFVCFSVGWCNPTWSCAIAVQDTAFSH
ncbi:MAG: hypothetical protein AAF378_09585 [Cyanobacteria bacterium P01_A01_bin.84]